MRIHINSGVAHVWLPYTVINMQRGENKHQKTPKVWKTSNFIKVVGSISCHLIYIWNLI